MRGIRTILHAQHDFEVIEAGRDLEQYIVDIKKNGLAFTLPVLRNAVLRGLGAKRKDGKAENVVIVGCATLANPEALSAEFHLLDALRVDYTLLERERCYGAPIIGYSVRRCEDRTTTDLASKEFIGMNLDQARELGAKRMIYLCPWCVYLARRFYPNCEIEQLFYFDLIMTRLSHRALRLKEPAEIAYFSGGQHRSWVYVPERDWDLDWPGYRSFLERIEGLKVVDIPKYCCTIAPDAIFQRVRKHKLSTIVTPCEVCHIHLKRKEPQGLKIRYLADLLLEALEGTE